MNPINLFELFAKIALDSSEYESGLTKASGLAQSVGGKIGSALETAAKVGTAALTAASGAAIAFGSNAVSVGQSFDQSMSQVAATMGFSVEQLNTKGSEAAETFTRLRDFAQEMGASTAFSASQAADALNYMALAGYDADTSIQMLPNVLNLAAAGSMDLAAASDMITDSQSALGLTLEQTSELVDKMAKASSKSNTSVSQLGSAILTVGGTAKDLAGGTTELSTVLGILADNGIKGAEGGTALRNIMQALIPKSEAAAKAYEQMGISAYDANGNLKPLSETFANFNKALAGKTSEERALMLKNIFNVYDLKSVNALLNTSAERWEELSAAIDNAAGASEAMANTQLDNLAGDMTIFQSALEGVKIAVSDEITPALREFVQLGTQGLSDLSAAIKEDGLGGAMKALSPFIDNAVGMFMEGIPKVIRFGGQLLGAVVSGIIDNLPKLAEGTVRIATEFGAYLLEAAPSIAAQGAGLIRFLSDGIIENMDFLSDTALNMIDMFAGFIGDALPRLAETATDIIVSLAETLSDPSVLANLAQSALAILDGIITAILDNLPRLAEAATGIVKSLGKFILDSFPDSIGSIFAAVSTIFAGVSETASRVFPQIRDTVTDAFDRIQTALAPVIDFISGAISGLMDRFSEYVSGGQAVQDITDTLSSAVEALGGFISTAAEGIADFVEWLTSGSIGADAFIATIGGIVTALIAYKTVTGAITIAHTLLAVAQQGVAAAQALVNAAMNANPFALIAALIAGVVTALVILWNKNEDFRNAVLDIWEAIKEGFAAAWEAIKTAASAAWEFIQGVFSAVGGFFVGVWEAIVTALTPPLNAVKAAFSLAWTVIQGVWSDASVFFKGVWEAIKLIFSVAAPVLKGFFSLAWSAVKLVWSVAVSFFKVVWNGIKIVFSVAKAVIGGFFSTAWAAVKLVWDTVTGYFQNIWNTIAGIFSAVESVLKGDFSGAWNAIKNVFHDWEDYFSGLWDDLTGVFSNAFNWFKDVGKNIVNGLREGIGGLWNGFLNFVGIKTDEGKDVVTGPDGVDTHSPSKWAEKVFRNVLEGGEIGLERGLPDMLATARETISDIRDSLYMDPFSISGAVSPLSAPSGASDGAYGVLPGREYQDTSDRPIIVQVVLDGKILGETVTRYQRNQGRAFGV